MNRFSIFHSIFFSLILLISGSVTCEPAQKKGKPTSFTSKDFETVIQVVDRHYIDRNSIDVNRAYVDSAVFALLSLPHTLYLLPESYYEEREKFEEKDEIMPGKTFKISPSDKFLIFEPDYKKVEQIRKERAKSESAKPKLSNDEIKKLVEREQARKNVLVSKWEMVGFTRKDFDKVISFISENISKYKTQPMKEPLEEVEESEAQKEEFSMKDVWLAAANGYLSSLDPHSNVFAKEVWEESMAKISDGSFEGIGAILSGGGNKEVIVENPLEDYPAVKAGVRAGDVILGVNGKSTKGLSLEKVVRKIKGKKGTDVALLVKRKGLLKPIEIKVTRDKIEIKNVQGRLLKDNEHIAYIKLSGFVKTPVESSDTEIEKTFHKLDNEAKKKQNKLKAVVLDLRNNAGGYLDLAIDIADMFITSGVIVGTKSPGRGLEESKAAKKDLTNLPVIVLINAKSASASEIVASAIKDHGRGLLLGERTFGKATVQKLLDLPDNNDYVVKITQSRYYAPSGRTIQVVGVEPDIEVSSEEDGSFPFQYREENMWHHLPKIPSEAKPKQYFPIEKYKDWVSKNGKAEKTAEQMKSGPIKPDYQLLRSIDYINAMLNVK
ncbi:MAG TPA: S41 family peptidase [Leptospiraceae bacterium]|nr:S41 family peptidase [Leptospiraceae bacterium]HNF13308.1 S41 family peptidase [Leptospiraceae bacterium]HNI97434.1 S41 family peptidase [Leptospiraceae bacterium]